MLVTALLLALIVPVHQRTTPSVLNSPVTCGIHTVSYRFVGEPGTQFTYGGTPYVVPASGWVELLAKRRPVEYVAAGHSLPLDVWPLDEFGTRTVPLPKR